jgi:hypothetical protein
MGVIESKYLTTRGTDRFTGLVLPDFKDYPAIIYRCILKGRELMEKKEKGKGKVPTWGG